MQHASALPGTKLACSNPWPIGYCLMAQERTNDYLLVRFALNMHLVVLRSACVLRTRTRVLLQQQQQESSSLYQLPAEAKQPARVTLCWSRVSTHLRYWLVYFASTLPAGASTAAKAAAAAAAAPRTQHSSFNILLVPVYTRKQ